MTVKDLLNILRNKGACQYTIHKGDKAMVELKALLPTKEYDTLSIARSHYFIGEGGQELMEACKELLIKYST